MRTSCCLVLAGALALASTGCGSSASTTSCPGATLCGGTCRDLQTDRENCGTCGSACPTGFACSGGACSLSCQSTLTNCSGTCRDLGADSQNCGSCGVACPGGSTCSAGTCAPWCQGALTSCAGTCHDLSSDPQSCGACGRICAASEACKSGNCDPCPVTQCNNVCVDTYHDPANCGACGAAVPAGQYCENGTVLSKITVELVPPLSSSPGSSYVTANGTAMPLTVMVHSALRVSRVTVRTAVDIAGLAAALPSDMTLASAAQYSPTVWAGSIGVPASGASMAIQIDAFDEQYLPSLGGGGTNPAHSDSRQLTAAITAIPTTPVTNMSATVNGTAVGQGTACAGQPCMWVPLNAGTLTLSAQVAGAPANGVVAIEFRNGPATGPSVLCPSPAFAAPGTPRSACARPVSASGIATLTMNAAEVGRGDVTIYACPVDATGLQYGTCTQMPLLSICGPGGTSACSANFTIGRVASCPSSAPCQLPVPPVIGRNVDIPANHTIYYLAYTDPPTNAMPGLFAQDATRLDGNASQQPGALLGVNHYFADGLLATAEGTGVFAVRCSTCTGTPAGNTAIDRVDCPNTGLAACYKQGFVTAPGGSSFRQIHVATGAAMLLSDAFPPVSTTGGNAFFATAVPSQVTAAAVAIGTLQGLSTINGAINASGVHWGMTAAGAIVAWFDVGGTIEPVVFHPNLPGNHFVALPTQAGALSGLDLVVFPTGEILYSYATATQRFLGAAYYDGTAAAPKQLAPIQIGPSASTTPGRSFITAGSGILLGEVPSDTNATFFQALEINLFAGTSTVPSMFKPAPYDGTTTGPLHEGGVFGRTGSASNFAISDDRTKAIFVTDDPPVAGQSATIWRLHLLDLAGGTASSLAASERMLCASTSSPYNLPCVPNASGVAHYPRFVRSAPVYAGAPPTGMNQVVVWEEEEPAAGTSVRHGRLSYATFSGGGSPVVGTVDRLNSYPASSSVVGFGTETESAAGGALYFLSDADLGGADLYAVSLTPPTTSPVASSRVLDRVFGFKVREDKARMLVARADGALYFAQLAGGGALPVLTPIAQNGPMGNPPYNGPYNGIDSLSYGFTSDGDHAYVVVDQQVTIVAGVGYSGVLVSIDLTPAGNFAQTNWGRISYHGFTIDAGFVSSAQAAEIVDSVSVDNFGRGRLTLARSATATLHGDTGLFSGDPSSASFSNFNFTASVDGSEGMVVYAGVANVFRSGGTFLPIATGSESLRQVATTSPFGGPYRPEWSQVDGNFFSGASSSIFKVWGTVAPASSPGPFIPISRGMRAVGSAGPAQTRLTPENTELLYSFADAAELPPNGAYTIWLVLSGRKAPDPLLP